jgi:hypothetical protein
VTLHQHLVNWFKQFKLTVLSEERERVTKNFLSGYACDKYERCPFVHMFSSLVANGRNMNLFEAVIKEKKADYSRNISSDEWVHMTDLATAWTDPEILIKLR